MVSMTSGARAKITQAEREIDHLNVLMNAPQCCCSGQPINGMLGASCMQLHGQQSRLPDGAADCCFSASDGMHGAANLQVLSRFCSKCVGALLRFCYGCAQVLL
jgi:hypothetical protein